MKNGDVGTIKAKQCKRRSCEPDDWGTLYIDIDEKSDENPIEIWLPKDLTSQGLSLEIQEKSACRVSPRTKLSYSEQQHHPFVRKPLQRHDTLCREPQDCKYATEYESFDSSSDSCASTRSKARKTSQGIQSETQKRHNLNVESHICNTRNKYIRPDSVEELSSNTYIVKTDTTQRPKNVYEATKSICHEQNNPFKNCLAITQSTSDDCAGLDCDAFESEEFSSEELDSLDLEFEDLDFDDLESISSSDTSLPTRHDRVDGQVKTQSHPDVDSSAILDESPSPLRSRSMGGKSTKQQARGGQDLHEGSSSGSSVESTSDDSFGTAYTSASFLHEGLSDQRSAQSGQRARQRLCQYVMDDIIGGQHVFRGPWGLTPVTYVDYVASGKPLHCIEDYISDHVLPMYANTHTEVSYTAQQTTVFREEARSIIKQCVNASDEDAVIFCGNGSTAAVNKLVNTLNPGTGFKPLILLGPYEHHSNILPWLQIRGAKVIRIQSTKDGVLDLTHLSKVLKKAARCCTRRRPVIGAFSAGSNITGILTDVNAICRLMHQHHGIACFDYACVAPYVSIDMNPSDDVDSLTYKDAIFISTHKFLGGPGTPGLLVAKKHCFKSRVPHNLGGGTVQFVRREHVSYRLEIEEREEGGTPAIIESIRAGLVFKLKETFTADFIMTREEMLLQKAKSCWSGVKTLVILGNMNTPRLPIFPILIYNSQTGRFLHHDFVAMLANDLFGLQVRSGCACAGPYGLDLMGIDEKLAKAYESIVVTRPEKNADSRKGKGSNYEETSVLKPGFVRLNIPFFFSEEAVNFVLNAIQLLAEHAWKLLYLYEFDAKTGKWRFKKFAQFDDTKKHLHDVTFEHGRMEIVEGLHQSKVKERSKSQSWVKSSNHVASNTSALNTNTTNKREKGNPHNRNVNSFESDTTYSSLDVHDSLTLQDVLTRAKRMLNPDMKSVERHLEKQVGSHLVNHKLRWFMLPEEALVLLRGGQVEYCPPDKLPFLPPAFATKLGLAPPDPPSDYTVEMSRMLKYKTVSRSASEESICGPNVSWIS